MANQEHKNTNELDALLEELMRDTKTGKKPNSAPEEESAKKSDESVDEKEPAVPQTEKTEKTEEVSRKQPLRFQSVSTGYRETNDTNRETLLDASSDEFGTVNPAAFDGKTVAQEEPAAEKDASDTLGTISFGKVPKEEVTAKSELVLPSESEEITEEDRMAAVSEELSTTQVLDEVAKMSQRETLSEEAEVLSEEAEVLSEEAEALPEEPIEEPFQPAVTQTVQKPKVEIDEQALQAPILKEGKSSWLGDQTVQVEHKKKKKRKRGHSVIGIIFRLLVIIVLVVGLAIGAMLVVYAAGDIFGLHESEEKITINIPANTSVSQVADLLKENEVIDYPVVFRAYIKYKMNNEVNFNFGTFVLTPRMSYDELIAQLERAVKSEKEVTVTIPEGFTVMEIATKLEENHVCTREEFLKAINEETFDYEFLESAYENKDEKGYVLEGYLYPDTYNFIESSAPSEIIKKFLDNFNRKVDSDMRVAVRNKGYTMDELVALASIVQKEAPTKDNMVYVASVYTNRLNASDTFPKLQADPTQGYKEDLEKEGFDSELALSYDAYESEGLPPGAIANPGMEALEAALHPRDTDYYYFCSDLGTGEFYYANTYDEHRYNLTLAGLEE